MVAVAVDRTRRTFSSPSGLPIGRSNRGTRNMGSSVTTKPLDPGLRSTHGQSGEFWIGGYVTCKPPKWAETDSCTFGATHVNREAAGTVLHTDEVRLSLLREAESVMKGST